MHAVFKSRRLDAVLLLVIAFFLPFGAACRAQEAGEPDIHAGETVLVVKDGAEFGLKDKVNAVLPAGHRIRVTEVRGVWIGGYAVVDNKRHTGWLHRDEVQPLRISLDDIKPIVPPDVDDDPAAVAALEQLGVELEKNDEGRTIGLIATETKLDDAGMTHLAGLKNLSTIELSGLPISDEGLKHLAGLPVVQKLYLDGTKITDAGLRHLKDLVHIEALALHGTQVDGSGLPHLAAMTKLQILNLSDCPVTNAALARLQQFPVLEVLAIPRTKVTSEGLIHLIWLEHLRVLNISGGEVTDDGLDHLEGLSDLRMLYVRDTEITDERVEELKEELPSLAIFQ